MKPLDTSGQFWATNYISGPAKLLQCCKMCVVTLSAEKGSSRQIGYISLSKEGRTRSGPC